MASSSGISSGSTQILNSGSDEEIRVVLDQRKRKRMQSNRESARRSRMRKQKHLDELMEQVGNLRKENNQIVTSLSVLTQELVSVEADNTVLRAQYMELSQRFESLNEILSYINCGNFGFEGGEFEGVLVSPWNLGFMNQPIMASADMFQSDW